MSGAGAFPLTRACLTGRTAGFQKVFDSWFCFYAISFARPVLREVIR
jgi:hypothetical protein